MSNFSLGGGASFDTSNPQASADQAAQQALQKAENAAVKAVGENKDVQDVVRRGSDTINKVENVLADTGTGAAIGASIGSAVPLFGTAVGGFVGTVAGAAYGVVDQFGDDISDAAKDILGNKPKYNEGDYQRMRKACVAAGGTSRPGVPPDQSGACEFPDHTTDGGYTPVWNPAKKAEYEADQAAKAVRLQDFGSWFQSENAAVQLIAKANDLLAAVNKTTTTPVVAQKRQEQINSILDFKAQHWDQQFINTDPTPFPSDQIRAELEREIPLPAPPPITSAALLLSSRTMRVMPMALKYDPRFLLSLLGDSPPPNAHPELATAANKTVVAARSGNPAAKAHIGSTVSSARAGHPGATVAANFMTQAQKILTRQRFVDRWVHGIVV